MSIHSTRRHLLGALGTGGLALGAAACGSSDPFEEEGSGSAGSDGGGEAPSGALAIGSQDYPQMIAGSLLVIVLALVLDLALLLLQRLTAPRGTVAP